MSTSTVWLTILGLFVTTFAVKAAGPLLTGGRTLPPRLLAVIAVLPAALLSALVVIGVLTDEDGDYAAGAPLAGVLVTAAIVWRGGGILPGVVAAAVVTALLRAVT